MDFDQAVKKFFEDQSKKMVELGLTPGTRWEDGDTGTAYICCLESGNGTYGSPLKECLYRHETGTIS